MFALYQHDLTARGPAETLRHDTSRFARALADGALRHQAELDACITRHTQGWALGRIAPLERSIMRVALLEILHPEEVPGEGPIPPEGAIDEAVETAKGYCGARAPAFLNGILAAALDEHRAGQAEATR